MRFISQFLSMRVLKFFLALFVVVGIPILIVFSTHKQFPHFSPIDEGAHYDYVKRIYSHGVPIMGDVILTSSLNDFSCYGVDLEGLVFPPCDSDQVTPAAFPGAGLQYEAQQPPAYYLFAASISPIIKWFGLGPLAAVRVSGLLLFFVANLAIYRAARLLKIQDWIVLPVIAGLNFSPVVAYQQSIVSNDVAVLSISSLILYLVARTLSDKKTPTVLWILVGAIAGLTKGTLLVAYGSAFFFTLFWSIRIEGKLKLFEMRKRIIENHAMRQVTMLTITAVLMTGLWGIFVSVTARIPLETFPTFDVLRQGPVSIQLIMRAALVGFYPLTQSFVPYNGMSSDSMALVNFIVNTSIIAACASGVFVATRVWWRVAGPILLVMQYLCALAIGISIWRVYDMDPGLASRHGLAAAPFSVLILCAGVQRRVGQVILSSGAVIVAFLYAINIVAST